MTTVSKPSSVPQPSADADPLRLIDVDHIRFYVGNAKQAASFYAHCFGFDVAQYADLTTGSREEASYLLTQGNIRLVLSTGLHKDHPAQVDVMRYGDGIKDVAFTVRDAAAAYKQAIANGGESAYEPVELEGEGREGSVVMAGV